MKNYGYIRVSSDDDIEKEKDIMREQGLSLDRLYIDDDDTEKRLNRENYKRLIEILQPGDVLFIKAIDNLGKNYDEIIKQWSFLIEKKRINIVVLDCPILDTREEINGITAKAVSDIFMQLLSYVAQIERDNMKQRQLEGIKEARKKGVKFGRPKKDRPDNYDAVYEQWRNKKISSREAARRLRVSNHTFKKWSS